VDANFRHATGKTGAGSNPSLDVNIYERLPERPLADCPSYIGKTRYGTALAAVLLCATLLSGPAFAQSETALGTNRPLQLPADSPFRDPDIVYLEADELINDETENTLTATGDVIGRYQDRTLRADRVIYNSETGEIFAEGNVTIVDPTGASQFAEKVNLSNELQAGTATNFTLRTAEGGLTAAALAQQNEDGSIDLFNAYYTACKVCEDDPTPTWRIKARRVSQDKDRRSIMYRDAVFEFMGIPVLYTPFLAHPDPSAKRATGFLTPLVGFTGDKGAFIRAPYFVAVDDYTNFTATPRLFTGVNPLLDLDFERQFATGRININTSFTYASIFDRDGNAFKNADQFLDPTAAPIGKRLRSHTFADGRFNPNDHWTYGFGVELTSDDLYLERYDLNRFPDTRGLFQSDALRLINQAYVVGQGDDWRVSLAAVGFQSQRSVIFELDDGRFSFSGEDDNTLPIIHPRLDAQRIFDVGGTRLEAFTNVTYLSRETGVDYGRASLGARWSDNFILPGGLEVEPFALARFDNYEIEPDILDADNNPFDTEKRSFTRSLGHVGADIRYPFIRPGKVNWILEPRVQITHAFGDGKLENFQATDANGNGVELLQDSLAVDLDPTLIWEPNKATGYDFWQEGTRIDAGGTIAARWDNNEASLFVGKSWADGFDNDFAITSGLSGRSSDIVAEANASFGSALRSRVRLRYDDDENALRRIDADAYANLKDLSANLRYYRIQGATPATVLNPTAPTEELSGGVRWRVFDNWSTSYRAFYDIDENQIRRQDIGLIFDDDCTRIEVVYTRDRNQRGVVGTSDGVAIRVALATLGSVD